MEVGIPFHLFHNSTSQHMELPMPTTCSSGTTIITTGRSGAGVLWVRGAGTVGEQRSEKWACGPLIAEPLSFCYWLE